MKRPPKPRIVKEYLKWAFNTRRWIWEPYHRVTWTEGGKRREKAVLLKWDNDPEELDRLYWQCRSGKHEKQTARQSKYTWGECVRLWREDPRVQSKLADSTKASYSRDMDAIVEKNGTKSMKRTTAHAIEEKHASMAETPRKADKHIAVISLLWNYALKRKKWPIGENPTIGILKYGKQSEREPWPDWMVAQLPKAPLTVQKAAELMLGTGQRPNAAIIMERAHFKGEWMSVLDEKQKTRFKAYCPERLRDFLAKHPSEGTFVLAKNLREPLGYDAIEKQFRKWRNTLGPKAKKYSLHGLRKLAIIQLAESGCSDAEIQAVTNQSLETVAYYRKLADRERLSMAAQKRRSST